MRMDSDILQHLKLSRDSLSASNAPSGDATPNKPSSRQMKPLICVTESSKLDLFDSQPPTTCMLPEVEVNGISRLQVPHKRCGSEKRKSTVNHLVPYQRQRSHSFSEVGNVHASGGRQRSGSIISLNPRAHKHIYLPVDHAVDYGAALMEKDENAESPSTNNIHSFADYIKVRKNSASIKSFQSQVRRRLVYKNGVCNVTHKHIKEIRRHYLADVFTTLIDLHWRWTLAIFIFAFLFTWTFFASIWTLIAFMHGDFKKESERPEVSCIKGVHSFTSAFLYSVETQHTIGYGNKHITEECPEGIVILLIQSITGVLVNALMAGMIFAKLSRPKKRAETLMFSKHAVICQRDGELCLMFRFGDMRNTHLIESHIRGMLVRRRVTNEGEVLSLDHENLDFGIEKGSDRLLVIWPLIIIHKINQSSPLWKLSRSSLKRENFEIIIVLEGVIESTGMTTQARTSYLPSELLWGHRFDRLMTYQKEGGKYQVDFVRFDSTDEVDTPPYSAHRLAVMKELQKGRGLDAEIIESKLERVDSNRTVDFDEEEDDECTILPGVTKSEASPPPADHNLV